MRLGAYSNVVGGKLEDCELAELSREGCVVGIWPALSGSRTNRDELRVRNTFEDSIRKRKEIKIWRKTTYEGLIIGNHYLVVVVVEMSNRGRESWRRRSCRRCPYAGFATRDRFL